MKEIKLTRGLFALVDDEDYEFLSQWSWCAKKSRNTYYAARCYRPTKTTQKTVMMHRLILGVDDPNIIIDHKDHNGLNNQKDNIRVATISQNTANTKNRKNLTSKYVGVSQDKKTGRWRAQMSHNLKKIYIGTFMTETEAAIAYNNMATELHGEFAPLNEIPHQIQKP